jgi:hypothetical protein
MSNIQKWKRLVEEAFYNNYDDFIQPQEDNVYDSYAKYMTQSRKHHDDFDSNFRLAHGQAGVDFYRNNKFYPVDYRGRPNGNLPIEDQRAYRDYQQAYDRKMDQKEKAEEVKRKHLMRPEFDHPDINREEELKFHNADRVARGLKTIIPNNIPNTPINIPEPPITRPPEFLRKQKS